MTRQLTGIAVALCLIAPLVSCGGDSGITVTPADPNTLSIAGGTGSGRVTSSDGKIDCRLAAGVTTGPTCTATYTSTATVTLTATADTDQDFKAWSGDCTGSSNCQVTVNRNIQVSPGFVPARETLDLDFQTPAADDGAAIITIEGPSVLEVVRTAGLEIIERRAPAGTGTISTVLVRGNLGSGAVAKVTIRGIHVGSAYTVRVTEVAARRTGNYAQRQDLTRYSASLK